MTLEVIIGALLFAAVVLTLTYIFRIHPALDEWEIRREMTHHASVTRSA